MARPALNLLVIRAKDPNRLAGFYKLLGIDFDQHQHGRGAIHYAADLGGPVLEIYPLLRDGDETTSTRLGFTVSGLDDTISRLREAGVAVLQEPTDSEWGRRVVVRDYEGHKVELCER